MQPFFDAWHRCAPATQLSLAAAGCAMFNPLLGIVVGLAAAWVHTRHQPIDFGRHLSTWYFVPVLIALAFIGQGQSLPDDDLMRHLSAWQLQFDYRNQYPWSNLPQPNLWLGFDYLLGALQRAGLSKQFLLQWVPGLGLLMQSLVLFGVLRRVLPPAQRNPELFLIAGAIGLLVLTPRSLLGRPEMFLLIFGVSAWLCRTRPTAAAWCAAYLCLIPFYWLGWVYAPFALLLAPARLRVPARLALGVLLGVAHLAFWQMYTGDYFGLLSWLKATMHAPATENASMVRMLSVWFTWVLVGALGLALSTLNKKRAMAALPVLLLLVWFALPNQTRYLAAIAFISLPWLYRTFSVWVRARGIRIPSVLVLLALALAAALAVYKTAPAPKFGLGPNARVYSESPYAAVFYGQPGIAVEPSFALGATLPEWEGIVADGKARCDLLSRGGFTHVIEKSLNTPLACAELAEVQGPWRLWIIKKGPL